MCHKETDFKPVTKKSVETVIPETLYYENIFGEDDRYKGQAIYPYTHAKLVYLNKKIDDKEYSTGTTVQEAIDLLRKKVEDLEKQSCECNGFHLKIVDNFITNSGVEALSARRGMILKIEKEDSDYVKVEKFDHGYHKFILKQQEEGKYPTIEPVGDVEAGMFLQLYGEPDLSKSKIKDIKDYTNISKWEPFFDYIATLWREDIDWIEVPWSCVEVVRIYKPVDESIYKFHFNRKSVTYNVVYNVLPRRPWDTSSTEVTVLDILDSEDPFAALSANQGRILNEKINAVTEELTAQIEEKGAAIETLNTQVTDINEEVEKIKEEIGDTSTITGFHSITCCLQDLHTMIVGLRSDVNKLMKMAECLRDISTFPVKVDPDEPYNSIENE